MRRILKLLEKPVRKLLVASQKSGVGKTTTSINLAAAAALAGTRVLLLDADPLGSVSAALGLAQRPDRRTLREVGVDLPGVLVCDVVPGLDVLSPYEADPCSDADLDDLLRLTDAPACAASYGCLVLNSPPFLGANPTQLVGACDGLVIVARAEPLAHRTLPAFLELIQRSQGPRPVKTHGILVTLPDGEAPGGRWERELRGRLAGRALPQVVPFDEAVSRAAEQGRAVVETAPDSPVAVPYHGLAEALKLAEGPLPLKKAPGPAALVAAAADLLQPVGASARTRYDAATSAAPALDAPDEVEAPDVDPPAGYAFPPEPDLPTFSGLAAVPMPSLSFPAFRPPPAAVGKLETKPTAPEPMAPARRASKPRSSRPWLVFVGLAVVVGVGLRFIHLPDFMLPVVVGVAVTAAVVLALRLLTAPSDSSAKAPALSGKGPKRDGAAVRKDSATRLAMLARATPSEPYRRPRKR